MLKKRQISELILNINILQPDVDVNFAHYSHHIIWYTNIHILQNYLYGSDPDDDRTATRG